MSDELFMRHAIEKAMEGIEKGQMPFGACIVKDGSVVSCTHNTILQDMSITAHAETNAIWLACNKLKTFDLSGCTIYCTCEPCIMCFGAVSLARIDRIVYGAGMEYADIDGFKLMELRDEELNKLGNGNIDIVKDFLKEESIELFKLYEEHKKKLLKK